MNRLRQYFFTGIAVLLPLVMTVLLFQYLWNIVDSLIVSPLYSALPFEIDRQLAIILIKSVILVLVVIIICLVGFGTNLFIVRRLIRLGESLLDRVPMVNRVYGVLKDISGTLFGKNKQKDLFRSAVLIEYPRKGLYSIAFITRTDHQTISEKSNQEVVSVFLPTTPNPTSGVLLFVPKQDVVHLDMTVEEAVKLVISAGSLSGKSARALKRK